MCTFDAPISRCEAMREMVITDQTQAQCAHEHACSDRMSCPLASVFTGVDFSTEKVTGLADRADQRLAA